ncbi:MAG: Ig-like domain-containing protein, partial [Bryobacteraceae bacterium]
GEPPASIGWDLSSTNNVLNHATLTNNGLGDPAPWEKLQGYPNVAEYALNMIKRAGSVQNLYVEGDDRYANKNAGARLRYRYVNGQLMDGSNGEAAQELWPWPMEQRVKDELGISVTCEVGKLINQYTASPIENIDPSLYCEGQDTAAPSEPTNVSLRALSASRVSVSWSPSTDNVGVAGYRIYRDGSIAGTSTTIPYTDSGLNPSTVYTYTVSAYDAAGNESARSAAASVTTSASSQAPTVSITAPVSGQTVSGNTTVIATASSEIGVAGVQFMLDGSALGSEDTEAPYLAGWNTSGVADGSHVLTAVARDVDGTQSASESVAVTVSNTGISTSGSTSVFAAYSFDQDSGSVLADISGNDRAGTIAGAVWTGGTFGNALSFSQGRFVRLGDFDVSPAFTVSAWAKPTSLSGCHSVVMKTYTYGIEICDGSILAEVGNGGNWSGTAQTSAVENTWQYITQTYDGNTIRLYVNGVLVDSADGVLTNSDQVLRIGAWTDGSEFFEGVIDEVRIYSRALTATEIQADMTTPIGSSSDTTAPSAPSGLNAQVQSTSQINLSWTASTDNVAVTGYVVYRNGSQVGTSATTTFNDTGLAAVTEYTYAVAAVDAAGNASGQSSTVAATTLTNADTTGPSVTITAPAGSQTVSGTITITASALDNVGVVGVQFILDGSNFGAEDTQAPYSLSWGTAATANGAHTLTAVARDAAGNRTTSAAVTVLVNNTATNPGDSAAVAFYSFNAGSGETLSDDSGNGHTGTISKATWTTGKYGSALLFRGRAFVRIGDLDSSPEFTVSAWVNPSSLSGCHSVAMKTFTYGFEICDGSVLAGVGNGGTWSGIAKASATVNTWQHITQTYDGSTVRLYMNGTLVASAAGALTNSDQDLRIGAWTDTSEFFKGVIDEVRIYSRALTAEEIQADMNNPIGSSSDTAAPSVPSGLNAQVQSTSAVNLSWTASTDNVAVTGYKVYRDGTQVGTIATTTYSDTGLTAATPYTYAVAAFDAAGNVSAQSSTIIVTTIVSADTTAPTVSIASPTNNQTVSGTVTITAGASDNVGVAGVKFLIDGTNFGAEDTAAPYSVTWDTSAATNGTHVLTAVARDAAGNQTVSSAVTVTVSTVTGSLSISVTSDNRSSYTNSQVPKYSKFEVTFAVANSVATNPQLPYASDPPSGIDPANYPMHKGTSVDALFTPDNWTTVYRQPAFVYQPYYDEVKLSWDGENREWHYPNGSLVWKARFAPNQTGTWQYKLVARDAGGAAESSVQNFTVASSDNKGFVKVSTRDPRYFEFDDGTPFTALGMNDGLYFDDVALNTEP